MKTSKIICTNSSRSIFPWKHRKPFEETAPDRFFRQNIENHLKKSAPDRFFSVKTKIFVLNKFEIPWNHREDVENHLKRQLQIDFSVKTSKIIWRQLQIDLSVKTTKKSKNSQFELERQIFRDTKRKKFEFYRKRREINSIHLWALQKVEFYVKPSQKLQKSENSLLEPNNMPPKKPQKR